ncbi:MAG TPA: hypothetical protein VHP11_02180 [Tepidisphaeraceae bacterium]|nr:hypothetical protein [Tepidisphaeraceae bacterium]
MIEGPLPPELAELEQRLMRREAERPSDLARARILQAVARELAQPSGVAVRRMGFWSYAASLAVAAILLLNLSLAAAMGNLLATRPKLTPQQTLARADAFRPVGPELSPADTRRMAVMLSAAESLVVAPLPRGSSVGSVSLTNTPFLEP